MNELELHKKNKSIGFSGLVANIFSGNRLLDTNDTRSVRAINSNFLESTGFKFKYSSVNVITDNEWTKVMSFLERAVGKEQSNWTHNKVTEVEFCCSKLSDQQFSEICNIISKYPSVQHLTLTGSCDIRDWTPIRLLINLKRLTLSHNIVDIAPLKHLVNLETLDISFNNLVDITPLAQLVNLERLVIRNNQIVDITPLKNLVNLKTLDIRCNKVVDITPLKHLVITRFLSF